MSQFYLPVPYLLTMLENTWVKQQTFNAGATFIGGVTFAANSTTWSNDVQYWNFQNNANLTFQWGGIGQVTMKGTTSSVQFLVINNYSGVDHFIQLGVVPSASNPTIASGTVYQNTTNSYQTIDIPCYASTAGTAGTVAVAYGTSSTPSTIYTQYVSGSTSSTAQSVIHLRVPPQWYYELTATGVTLGTPTMVQE